jgi:hypothetical protein
MGIRCHKWHKVAVSAKCRKTISADKPSWLKRGAERTDCPIVPWSLDISNDLQVLRTPSAFRDFAEREIFGLAGTQDLRLKMAIVSVCKMLITSILR